MGSWRSGLGSFDNMYYLVLNFLLGFFGGFSVLMSVDLQQFFLLVFGYQFFYQFSSGFIYLFSFALNTCLLFQSRVPYY